MSLRSLLRIVKGMDRHVFLDKLSWIYCTEGVRSDTYSSEACDIKKCHRQHVYLCCSTGKKAEIKRIKKYIFFINNCPARCNTKQSIYYSASSLNMFRVSTTPSIRSTQNCNYSLRYCAAISSNVATLGCVGYPKHLEWTCRIINRLLCVASRWTIINIDQRCTEP